MDQLARPALPFSGQHAVEAYLASGYDQVVGMSSRFAAAICARLLRLQTEEGLKGPIAEIGAFEGRFFIALAHALEEGEIALALDIFSWPDPGVEQRFEANCARHGIGPVTPSSVCSRSSLAQIAAAKREDMPTTRS